MVEDLTVAINNADKWFWENRLSEVRGYDPSIGDITVADYDRAFYTWLLVNYGIVANTISDNPSIITYEVVEAKDKEKAVMFKLEFG